MTQRYGEYLEVVKADQQAVLRCRKCGITLCAANEDPVPRSLVHERHISELGQLYGDEGSRFLLREAYCPECLTRFYCELVLTRAPHLREIDLLIE